MLLLCVLFVVFVVVLVGCGLFCFVSDEFVVMLMLVLLKVEISVCDDVMCCVIIVVLQVVRLLQLVFFLVIFVEVRFVGVMKVFCNVVLMLMFVVLMVQLWFGVVNIEYYIYCDSNLVQLVSEQFVFIFGLDVDIGLYINVCCMLEVGQLLLVDVVCVEEFINYFDYGYVLLVDCVQFFSVIIELVLVLWNLGCELLLIGVQDYWVLVSVIFVVNLVFFIDIFGLMDELDKLFLFKVLFK